jgi:hypothetical protein
MYTGVNDIMRLDRGPGSSLDAALLVTSLKALTTDQFSAELMVPTAVYESICVNQAMRTALLAIMPTLDDVDIALGQRGDQSCGMVIPRLDGLGGATGGHGRGGGPPAGRGGVPAGGGLVGSRSGTPAGGRGGGPVGDSSTALAPGKGKHARVVLDDDEVSSDEDEPLQKRLRQLFGDQSVVLDEATVMMSWLTRRPQTRGSWRSRAEEGCGREAVAKAAAAEEVAGKTANEAA